MARSPGNLRFGVLVLALAIAGFLWGLAHGASDIERGFDVPVELHGLADTLVMTDLSSDVVNVQVLGSRAALRNIKASELFYRIDASGGKRGRAEYEVDVSRIDLPQGAQIVSRSPSHLQLSFERRGRKVVAVRADIEGEPAEGYRLAGVELEPSRVWLAGARSQVLRLREVVTEAIDVSGLEATDEREVRLFLGGDNVWVEEQKPVVVRILVEPDPALLEAESEKSEGEKR